jgi:RNA recognition motif-containing protein
MSQILLGNLPAELTEEHIREFFSAGTPGAVTAVSIPSDPKTGKSRGYAFVDMDTDDEASQAVQDLNGRLIEGRRVSMSVVASKRAKRKWYQFDRK